MSSPSQASLVLLALLGLDALVFVCVFLTDVYLGVRSLGVYVLGVCSVGAGVLLTIGLGVSVLVDRARR